ncbi:MAG: formate dehydrogenase accessory sulfurtransferase FdhD [Acidimicrobiales bacterium]
MARRRTEKILIRRVGADGESAARPDEVIVEEPLSILLDGVLVTTTMRTPGHDFELAVGFCLTEGLLAGAPVRTCRYCGPAPAAATDFNVVSVDTGGLAPAPTPRLGLTSSSCGLCGSEAIASLAARLAPLPAAPPWPPEALLAVCEAARAGQELFDRTGAVHAAAAVSRAGEAVVIREDIGRHNAVDKVIGRLALDQRLPARGLALYVSGRASFELVQKAWAGGFEALVAVSAPSALAVATARAAGLALAGFVRRGALNLYAP